MSKHEKEEIKNLPEKYRPMGAWSYFGFTILYNLPLVGTICCIIFSFLDGNVARRSFARSFLVVWIIYIALAILIGVLASLSIIPMPDMPTNL